MSKKKKNYPRTFIKVAGKKVCIEELIEAVNQCDKDYGIRLKHPDIWADPNSYLQVISARADMNIAAMICVLNGIDLKDYFETDSTYGMICKPVGINHPYFTYSSILGWDDEVKSNYNTDSLIFRCRFVTLVISQIMGELDDVTYREVIEKYNYRHSKDEKRIILTKDIMNDIVKFILIMVNQDSPYQNIILKIHEHISYTKKNVNHSKLRNLLNGHVLNIRKGMREDLFTERFMSDDLCIYNTLKVAYMLATNKTNLNVIPKFKYIEHATVKHDLIKLIEELGGQIISNTKDKKYSPMFRAFIEARPSVWSQFYKEAEESYAVQIGLLALAYAKFVFNNETMDEFIDKMLKKGI